MFLIILSTRAIYFINATLSRVQNLMEQRKKFTSLFDKTSSLKFFCLLKHSITRSRRTYCVLHPLASPRRLRAVWIGMLCISVSLIGRRLDLQRGVTVDSARYFTYCTTRICYVDQVSLLSIIDL